MDHDDNIGFPASLDRSLYYDRYFRLSMYCHVDQFLYELLMRLPEYLTSFIVRL